MLDMPVERKKTHDAGEKTQDAGHKKKQDAGHEKTQDVVNVIAKGNGMNAQTPDELKRLTLMTRLV